MCVCVCICVCVCVCVFGRVLEQESHQSQTLEFDDFFTHQLLFLFRHLFVL